MEALLAQMESVQPVTGARAWEEMDLAAGVTVKRIPSGGDPTTHLDAVPETVVGSKTVTGLGSGRSSGSSTKSKAERRVVTAIFAPSGSDVSAATLKPLESTGGLEAFPESGPSPEKKSRPLPPTPGQAADEGANFAPMHIPDPVIEPETLHIERLLEEEIMVTRALLDTFRARLEIVEQKVADLEVKEAVREREEALVKAAHFMADLHAMGFAFKVFDTDLDRLAERVPDATLTELDDVPAELAHGLSVKRGVRSYHGGEFFCSVGAGPAVVAHIHREDAQAIRGCVGKQP